MESAQLAIDGTANNLMGAADILANSSTSPAQAEHYGSPNFVPAPASPANKGSSRVKSQVSLDKNTSSSVSNYYFFKSRLQEYAQKAGIRTPVYATIKEGPSHEPSFRSSVIVNNAKYDSLPGFFNRKAAEQSAAEVALIELANSVDTKFGISQPVHETGLCKNLLQEYAQKMNYAIPLYECQKDEKQGKKSMYSCVVEIGGIKYIGASTSTKKEAEIKVARTALLAIQSAASVSEDHAGNSVYSVIPHKKKVTGLGISTQETKKVTDLGISTQETAAALKPKKGRFKKQQQKKMRALKRCKSAQGKMSSDLEVNVNGQTGVESCVTDAVGVEVSVTDVSSQVETAGGLGELSVTNADSFQEPDSGLTVMENTSNICTTGLHN